MAFLAALLAVVLLAPAAQAAEDARGRFVLDAPGIAHTERGPLMHGVAGDRNLIFVTEPGLERPGATPKVTALDRATGRKVATLPQPPGGFKLPFALRVPRAGTLAVLDNSGFPPVGPPKVHEYSYSGKGRDVTASLRKTISFDGLPLFFAEDIEVLPHGRYVVSESIVGALWVIGRTGRVRPGLVPSNPFAPLAPLGPCLLPAGMKIGGIPFVPAGLFAPGAGSLAFRDGQVYFGSSCRGGIQRVPVATLLDRSSPAEARIGAVEDVSPKPAGVAAESLKGLSFNRWDRKDRNLYVGDPFHLRLLRIDPRTGRRTVVSRDAKLFNFTVATAFLPPLPGGRGNPLVAVADQEHRWAGVNPAVGQSAFEPPFVVTKVIPGETRAVGRRQPSR